MAPSVTTGQHRVMQIHRQASLRRAGRPSPVHPHHRAISPRLWRSSTEHLARMAYTGGGRAYYNWVMAEALEFLNY